MNSRVSFVEEFVVKNLTMDYLRDFLLIIAN